MVDPLSLAAITAAVTAAAGALGSEAGTRSWAALTRLGRRALGRADAEPDPEPAPSPAADPDPQPLPAVRPDDPEVQQLAAVIYARALQDAAFAADLRTWMRESEEARGAAGGVTVHNVVQGNARVRNLIQANEVTWHSTR
ncbi:hypothetical protein ACFVUW_09600 [Streptomyces xiamenensis]|uniref:hypothetical protein n=1 Tax=Streptomyces xiamenensis TaxID=408015 RepID=UPI0036E794AD